MTVHYDPMIAKVIAHGRDRREALARLAAALGRTEVVGVTTNAGFLKRLVEHPEVIAGPIDIGFVGREIGTLAASGEAAPAAVRAIAGRAEMRALDAAAKTAAARTGDRHSPWARADGWRLNDTAHHDLVFEEDGRRRTVRMTREGGAWTALVDGERLRLAGERDSGGGLTVTVDGVGRAATVVADGGRRVVFLAGRSWLLALDDPYAAGEAEEGGEGRLLAPMPAKVIRVAAAVGDRVARGDVLLVLEAMKMEHSMTAPADGTVARLAVAEGDLVEEGAELAVLEADETHAGTGSGADRG